MVRRPAVLGPGLLVLLLCLATAALKAWVLEPRTTVGHGDSAHYFNLARALRETGSLRVGALGTWFGWPDGLPASGVVFWRPLPAVIGALGMAARGESTYRAASLAMIAVTSLLPWLTWLLGRDLFEDRRAALVAAFLAATFHTFLFKGSMPITYGPAAVLGAAVLWTLWRARSSPRWLWATGILVGLGQLDRTDAILWVPVVLLVLLVEERGAGSFGRAARRAVPFLLGTAAGLAPLWIWNLAEEGTPQPGSVRETVLLTRYADLYALPQDLTLERTLEPGLAHLAAERAEAAGANAVTVGAVLAVGTSGNARKRVLGLFEGDWDPRGLALLVPALVALVGVSATFRRRFLAFWAMGVAGLALHSLVLTHTGEASLRAFLSNLHAVWLVVAAVGLLRLLRPLAARSKGAHALALALALVAFAVTQTDYARGETVRIGRAGEQMRSCHRALRSRLLQVPGFGDAPCLVPSSMVHELHANTRLLVASTPLTTNEGGAHRRATDRREPPAGRVRRERAPRLVAAGLADPGGAPRPRRLRPLRALPDRGPLSRPATPATRRGGGPRPRTAQVPSRCSRVISTGPSSVPPLSSRRAWPAALPANERN